MNTDLYVYRILAFDVERAPQIPGHGPVSRRVRKQRFTIKEFSARTALELVAEISGRERAEIRRVRKAWWWE